MSDYHDRIRNRALLDKVVDAETAAKLVKDGMVIGMSGFTRAGEAKAVPLALSERAKKEQLKIALLTGASLGNDLDKIMAESGLLARRMPFQADPALRKAINAGTVYFIDQHLSHTSEQLRSGHLPKIDVAIIEAVAITPEGGIIPSTSLGNSASFAMQADKVIVEVNLTQPVFLEGLHDVYVPGRRPTRDPIPVQAADSRIGTTFIPVDPERIAAIVITEKPDSPSNTLPPDEETAAIAGHLTEFLINEVKQGRLSNSLAPLQAGIGTIANAVLHGFIQSPFHDLTMYSEVLQDSTFDLFDSGKLTFASAASLTLSAEKNQLLFDNFEHYRPKLMLRPQEISNHPEVIRRLGIIGINTALEFDIYGNVNSTHVGGTHMMNGIGGSGDFARNGSLTIFVTKASAKGGAISSVVPMVSHVDHTEHDVQVLVTEHGLADLRGLAPRERVQPIIDNCADPAYRERLWDYYKRASQRGGQTPHLLQEAFSWHLAFNEKGTMA